MGVLWTDLADGIISVQGTVDGGMSYLIWHMGSMLSLVACRILTSVPPSLCPADVRDSPLVGRAPGQERVRVHGQTGKEGGWAAVMREGERRHCIASVFLWAFSTLPEECVMYCTGQQGIPREAFPVHRLLMPM